MPDPIATAILGIPVRRISPLARRLVAATIAVSTLVALLATAFQLYSDFRRNLGQIDTIFRQIDHTYLPTIANALWATNRHEVQVALDGLKQLPYVQYVAVRESDKLWAESGRLIKGRRQSRDYLLTHRHRDQTLTIGTLHIVLNIDGIYQRLLERFWIILLTNSIKTFIVAGFMLWLFHWLVTRHLQQIAAYAARLGSENLSQRLTLDRPINARPDEFDQVLEGFKLMQFNLSAALQALRQDIIARERVEEEIRQLNAQLEQRVADRTRQLQEQARIIDEIHDAVLAVDLHGALNSWNRGAERLFGYTAIEALGRNADFLFPEVEAIIALHHVQDAQEIETRIRRKNGAILDAHFSLSPLYTTEQQRRGVACYAIDISARTQAQALAASRAAELAATNRELEAFSYSVSHDLRAPLRSIDGFSQALIEDCSADLDPTGHAYLQRIRRAAQRMGLLIDDLLRLAHVARIDMHHTQFNLSALATEIVTSLDRYTTQDHALIHIQPDLTAFGDVALLRIVLENLLGNALKFTAKTPRPQIDLGALAQAKGMTYFVRDNGAGFDMAFVAKLFGAFQRLHREEDFPGTGIGLATVKRIIHRHGGEVWAESVLGAGATFFFTLPNRQHADTLRRLQTAES